MCLAIFILNMLKNRVSTTPNTDTQTPFSKHYPFRISLCCCVLIDHIRLCLVTTLFIEQKIQ